eukprot:COSAG03_NODE_793_length_5827_cov_9.210719_6_plen_157_part_00
MQGPARGTTPRAQSSSPNGPSCTHGPCTRRHQMLIPHNVETKPVMVAISHHHDLLYPQTPCDVFLFQLVNLFLAEHLPFHLCHASFHCFDFVTVIWWWWWWILRAARVRRWQRLWLGLGLGLGLRLRLRISRGIVRAEVAERTEPASDGAGRTRGG